MFLLACSDNNAGTESNAGDWKIAVLLAETGRADFIGRPERDVTERLIAQYVSVGAEDMGVEFVFYDTGTSIKQAEQIYSTVALDPSYLAIIGPSTSGESLALAERADSDQIPLLSLAASSRIVIDESKPNGVRPWVFKFAQNDQLAAAKLATVVGAQRSEQLTQVGLLYSNDGFGQTGAEAFRHEIDGIGHVDLVYERSFPPSLSTPSIVVDALPSDLDSVLIWGTSPGPALLVKELAKKRPQLKVFLSHGNASDQFINDAGVAAEGATVVGSRVFIPENSLRPQIEQDRVIIDYQEFWSANFSGAPNHFAGHAYDAINMVVQIVQANYPKSRSEFRRAIETYGTFNGVTGTFEFTETDHAGLKADAFAIYQIRGGRMNPVSLGANQ